MMLMDMKLCIFNKLTKAILISLLSLPCLIYTTANARSVYDFDAAGTIGTSGGLDGLGLGTLFVDSAFTATFDTQQPNFRTLM